MSAIFKQGIEKIFTIQENEGKDKVVSLEDAISKNIEQGLGIFVGGNPNAGLIEVIRQFWDLRPQFVLITAFALDRCIDMIHTGLVKKLITSNCFESAPTIGPSSAVQHAYKEKKIEIESWSLFSIIGRLVAGAMRIGFIPTKSIMGSSMADENKDSFKEVDDPFENGVKIGVVRALNPDISIIHGLVADRSGNTILAPDFYANGAAEWGALAARGGVVVTVEKLVNTEFIRKHSFLVKIPSCLVKSVSEVPLGAHPQGLYNYGIEEIEGYGADNEFAMAYRRASDVGKLDNWIKEWILDCSRQKYLRKLGYEKIQLLKGKADKDIWRYGLASMPQDRIIPSEYTPRTMMIIAAARKIKEKVNKHFYNFLLVGAGASAIPSWIAYYQLRKENQNVELLQGCGLLGYSPRPMYPEITNLTSLPTCKVITDSMHIYGVFVGNNCLSVFGAGQIDKYGNINSTRTSEGGYLTGSGGANDAANAAEILVIIPQSPGRFVDKVPYITCKGDRVLTVVSSMGIFEKLGDEKELKLTGYYHSKASGSEERVREIKERCGWNLKVATEIKEIPIPTCEELMFLGLFDPAGLYTSDHDR